jgi:hypothetical protein
MATMRKLVRKLIKLEKPALVEDDWMEYFVNEEEKDGENGEDNSERIRDQK